MYEEASYSLGHTINLIWPKSLRIPRACAFYEGASSWNTALFFPLPLRRLEPEYVTWNATILPLNRASALLRAQLALNTISQSRTDKIRLVNE